MKPRYLPILVLLVACAQEPAPTPEAAARPPATLSSAPVSDAVALADSTAPALWVDVRTPEEFASGHVEGAINIPHDQMEARWQELEAYKDQHVGLYCRSGRRSGIALDILEAKGFTAATNEGGFSDVAARGVPTIRP